MYELWSLHEPHQYWKECSVLIWTKDSCSIARCVVLLVCVHKPFHLLIKKKCFGGAFLYINMFYEVTFLIMYADYFKQYMHIIFCTLAVCCWLLMIELGKIIFSFLRLILCNSSLMWSVLSTNALSIGLSVAHTESCCAW